MRWNLSIYLSVILIRSKERDERAAGRGGRRRGAAEEESEGGAKAAVRTAALARDRYGKSMRAGPARSESVALWRAVTRDEFRAQHFQEWVRLGHYMLAIPMTSVACERRFSLLKFIKGTLRTALGEKHLDVCMRVAAAGLDPATYDCRAAMEHWMKAKKRHA